MSHSSAARTNLHAKSVIVTNQKLGEGHFRECFAGTYVGGCRNKQAAVCKRFKQRWRSMEMEYFASDFKIADTAIRYAEGWNSFCCHDEIILVTKGNVLGSKDGRYLCEPLIRNFKKFTSNSGWIKESECWTTQALEAFSHYTYHASGEEHLVCDLQGRYRDNRRFRNSSKSRFELTDVAICSRAREFGPTDLGEKGIESFFANHVCNDFCNEHWSRPYRPRRWFPRNSSATSMFSSRNSHLLQSSNRIGFQLGGLGYIVEEGDSSDESSSYDDEGSYDEDWNDSYRRAESYNNYRGYQESSSSSSDDW
mmetsp:Transcript_22339/g.53139  ORF Transcript_22339/g.53139 Transcript_22339/m.53139 type:complete len:309 (+) Transcript_22339:586-1512(+)